MPGNGFASFLPFRQGGAVAMEVDLEFQAVGLKGLVDVHSQKLT